MTIDKRVDNIGKKVNKINTTTKKLEKKRMDTSHSKAHRRPPLNESPSLPISIQTPVQASSELAVATSEPSVSSSVSSSSAVAWPKALLGNANNLEQVGARWLEFLSKLPLLQKQEFLIGTSHSLLERDEIQVHLAELQKDTIEKITEGEYQEMEITKEEFLKQSRWELIQEMFERKA